MHATLVGLCRLFVVLAGPTQTGSSPWWVRAEQESDGRCLEKLSTTGVSARSARVLAGFLSRPHECTPPWSACAGFLLYWLAQLSRKFHAGSWGPSRNLTGDVWQS